MRSRNPPFPDAIIYRPVGEHRSRYAIFASMLRLRSSQSPMVSEYSLPPNWHEPQRLTCCYLDPFNFMSMNENRRSLRQRVLKAGMISFDHAGIDCTVRNISDNGASLEVESPVGVPNDFTLVINKDGVKRPCHVTWRSARRIGVRFD